MIKVGQRGGFNNLENFLKRAPQTNYDHILHKYGAMGVSALSAATPVDTMETANSWSYKINKTKNKTRLEWHNESVAGSVPVVILLQYGHATVSGGFVQGRDFVNPALKDIFTQLSEEVWKEVNK